MQFLRQQNLTDVVGKLTVKSFMFLYDFMATAAAAQSPSRDQLQPIVSLLFIDLRTDYTN